MINLLGIIIMLIAEAFIIYILFTWQKEKHEIEVTKRDETISYMLDKIKSKNNEIKELQDELKRANDKRLRKNY